MLTNVIINREGFNMYSPQEIFPQNLPVVGMIKTGFRLQWQDRNLRKITGLVIVITVFIKLINFFSERNLGDSLWLYLSISFLGYLFMPIYTGMVIRTIQSIQVSVTMDFKNTFISSIPWFFPLLALEVPNIIFQFTSTLLKPVTPSSVSPSLEPFIAIAICLLGIPLIISWIISIPVFQYSSVALIIENISVWHSVKRGWVVFKKNVFETIGLYVLFFMIGFVIVLVFMFPFICYAFSDQSLVSFILRASAPNLWISLSGNILLSVFSGYIGTGLIVILTIGYLYFRKALDAPVEPRMAKVELA
jgi:hypothetical protein